MFKWFLGLFCVTYGTKLEPYDERFEVFEHTICGIVAFKF